MSATDIAHSVAKSAASMALTMKNKQKNVFHDYELQLLILFLCHEMIENINNTMTSWNGSIFMLLALCAGNSPVTGEFLSQRPVTWRFGAFFDLRND